jgi:hypothetical protein
MGTTVTNPTTLETNESQPPALIPEESCVPNVHEQGRPARKLSTQEIRAREHARALSLLWHRVDPRALSLSLLWHQVARVRTLYFYLSSLSHLSLSLALHLDARAHTQTRTLTTKVGQKATTNTRTQHYSTLTILLVKQVSLSHVSICTFVDNY